MAADPDDLVAWIDELGGLVARGDLDGLGPVDVHGGRLDADLAIRIMLAT